MNEIFKNLHEAFKNKKTVAIYKNRKKPECCIVGKVEFLNESEFILQSISPDGFADGYLIRKTDNIWKVEIDEEYPNAVEKLALHRGTIIKPFFENYTNIKNIIFELLMLAKNKNLLVTIFKDNENDDSFTGSIKDMDKENITLSTYNFYGEYEDECTLEIQKISSIDCDTLYEQNIKILMQHTAN